MLSKDQVVKELEKAASAVEIIHNAMATVYVNREETDEETGITEVIMDRSLFPEAIPCRLSFRQHANQDEGQTHSGDGTMKLFTSPKMEIPAGSLIIVEQYGKTYKLTNGKCQAHLSYHAYDVVEKDEYL